jgi:hypothetical protein
MAVTMKIYVLLDMIQCTLVDGYHCFKRTFYLRHQGRVSNSLTLRMKDTQWYLSVKLHCIISQDSNFQALLVLYRHICALKIVTPIRFVWSVSRILEEYCFVQSLWLLFHSTEGVETPKDTLVHLLASHSFSLLQNLHQRVLPKFFWWYQFHFILGWN